MKLQKHFMHNSLELIYEIQENNVLPFKHLIYQI